jgi:hypothetical protein
MEATGKTENELRLQERVYTLAAKMGPFAVMREALIDIRESCAHTNWTRNTKGWKQLETYKKADEIEKVEGVFIEIPREVGRDKAHPYARFVKRLYLSDSNLTGPLPWSALMEMPCLETLDLSHNKFAPSAIPDDLFLLRRLQKLFVSGCSLKGVVPDFLRHESLHTICISDNPLLGGRIRSVLVRTCERVEYGNCKQEGDADGPAMWGPLILGASIAAEEVPRAVRSILALTRIDSLVHLCIHTRHTSCGSAVTSSASIKSSTLQWKSTTMDGTGGYIMGYSV